MPRGGARPGAGSKPKWKHGKTKTIRVPESLANEIMEYVRKLDSNGTLESVSDSKVNSVIDLSGISLTASSGELAVKLSELVKKGYLLKPDSLNRIVSNSLAKK